MAQTHEVTLRLTGTGQFVVVGSHGFSGVVENTSWGKNLRGAPEIREPISVLVLPAEGVAERGHRVATRVERTDIGVRLALAEGAEMREIAKIKEELDRGYSISFALPASSWPPRRSTSPI